MRKIAFVCLGNICRSPMAEFVMKDLVNRSGRNGDFEIVSRATSGWEHGNSVHRGTQAILKQKGIPFDQRKTSQQIKPADFIYFDEIIAMDESNLTDLRAMAPAGSLGKIHKLLSEDVPDPWYSGNFALTYQLISAGLTDLLKQDE